MTPDPLSELEVLIIDCQATAAAPRGHLLEIGWAKTGHAASAREIQARLVAIPSGEQIPPAVVRITGISSAMVQEGVPAEDAWRELARDAGALSTQPAPTIIHFSRFELPFLHTLAGGPPPLDIVCTHEIARRLLPDLPRRGVRALAGYFGHGVSTLRRSADHIEATRVVWHALAQLLEGQGISTWQALREWLAATPVGTQRRRRVWPMPRELRLSLPESPGVYRMLRTNGDVLYVGKAGSLRHRVNSYFRKQSGTPERLLEMLSQARGLSFERIPTTLEAALFETDEIKRLLPPYNVALTIENRSLWFASPDLSARSDRPTAECSLGPFPSAATLESFKALAAGDRRSLGPEPWGPDASTFEAGYARFCAQHPELCAGSVSPNERLLRLGNRLWREGRRDHDVEGEDESSAIETWTPELVQRSLEWLALRAALARRRAIWLTRLVDVSVVWTEPGSSVTRLLIVENGEVVLRGDIEPGALPPVPPGHARSVAERREGFTLDRFDRLRVLSTELRRLVTARAAVAVRLGAGPPLAGDRLADVLSWV
jgi:DNA polymerase-3 subunit epsilon